MTAVMSKRQQARNERTLQDLIKSVPGNNACADCGAKNPGWASWSLGVFLCMRCAALHRKLGTHITKVKSLSMDSWSIDQVENMKRVGNVASNRTYNPQNAKPPIPFDADEADSAMERFIRQKYQGRPTKVQTQQNTGSTNSDDHPPPLPPKTGMTRFGFRSASSIFPLSSKAKREAAAQRPESHDRPPSPPRRNKPSKLFGTDVGEPNTVNLESSMIYLRDMGFKDERQNLAALKNVGGDIHKAIRTLVKAGESQGDAGISRSHDSALSSGSRTPVTPSSGGISVNRTRDKSLPRPSSNPFDMLDIPPTPAQTQSSQSTGTLGQSRGQVSSNPFQHVQNTNPFGIAPNQSQYPLDQAFQNLTVSPPSQPLFPNHTGGFPGPQQQQQPLHMQSMTPPVPSVPQQYYPPVIYENAVQQPQQNYNPFMQQQQRPPPTLNTNIQSTPFVESPGPISAPVNGSNNTRSDYFGQMNQMPQATSANSTLQTNPYAQHQQGPQSNLQSSSSQASAFYGNSAPQQAQQPYIQHNPFLPNSTLPALQQSYTPQQQQQHNPYQQFQGQINPQINPQIAQIAQQVPKPDKRSILNLYNYPQLAPTPLQQSQTQNQDPPAPLSAPALDTQQQTMNVPGPMSAGFGVSRNPFMNTNGGPQAVGGNISAGSGPFSPAGPAHPSRESVMINAGDWQNGRHSPDAWGTISARSMR